MAILITGGAGYIGSHTAVSLLSSNEEIVIVDNFSNSKPETLKQIKEISDKNFAFYEVDITDINELEKVFEKEKITEIIHFAALKAVGKSVENPIEYYANNMISTLNLLTMMKKYDVKKLVFSSSATVYGSPKTVPILEDFALSTTNPYGTTKLMAEEIYADVCKSDKSFSIAILRYFNPVGAHKSGLIGENPNGIPNNLMPYIVDVGEGILPYLNVFGDDYDTPDGTGVRDYIHVLDLAQGHNNAIDWVRKNKGIDYFNLGTGKGYSVLEMVNAYEKVTNKKINYKIAPRRNGDIAQCYADVQKAKKCLNWEAKHSLEEMCEDSERFIRMQK